MANDWFFTSGVDGDANTLGNWTANEDGSGGSPASFAAADSFFFSDTASSSDCTMSSSFACANLFMAAADTGGTDDWSGTFSCASFDLAVSASVKDSNTSTIDFGSGTHSVHDMTMDGSCDLGSCSMTVSGSVDCTDMNACTYGTSTCTFTGTEETLAAATILKFYDLVITGSLTSTGRVQIYNSIDIGDGATLTNNGQYTQITSGSTMTLNTTGTLTGTAYLYWQSANAIPTGGTLDPSRIDLVNGTGGIPARTYDCGITIIPNGDFTYTTGAGTITINGNFILDNGTHTTTLDLNANDSTIDLNGNLDFSDTDGTFTVDMGGSTWDVSGNIDISGADTWTYGTSTVEMTGSGKTIKFGGNALYDIEINSAGTITPLDGMDFHDLLITSGTLDNSANNPNLNVSGDMDTSGGTYTKGTGALVFDGTAAQSITLDGDTVESITVSNTSNTVTFEDSHTCTTSTFAAGSSIVFTASETYTYTNISWVGTGGNKITLRSSASGTAWDLVVSGTISVKYVDVQDSDASGGSEILAINSVDSGRNVDWNFGAASNCAIWFLFDEEESGYCGERIRRGNRWK